MYEHDPARTTYQDACDLLLSQRLPCPPIPKRFISRLQQTRYSALFTTEPTMPDPYHFQFYLNQVLTGRYQTMAVFGVSGHGISSKAMHNYLIEDHLVVLLQDGLPDQPEGWQENLMEEYGVISQLSIACQDAVQNQKLKEDETLVICRSFFDFPQWGVINRSGDRIIWKTVENPIQSAIDWLMIE